MKNLLKIVAMGLAIGGLAIESPYVHAEKKAGTQEQVAVLLKWYHSYFEEGKYKQAEQVAELARDLAPEDPQIAVALKLAQRQQSQTVSALNVEVQLERVLGKLDRMDRELRSLEASRFRRARIRIAQEPPGSPDAFRPGAD